MSFESAMPLDWNKPMLAFPFRKPWQPKIPFEIRQQRYIIKTAQTEQELEAVIQLRTDVFLREFAGKGDAVGYDIEERDEDADFLIIKDALTHEVFASYRLISSRFSNNFYSMSEFDLGSFREAAGHKLELSRACVRADKRNRGVFVHLLWRGLGEYIARSGCRYLFGCSSIQVMNLSQIVQVYNYLKAKSYLSHDFAVNPLQEYRIFDPKGIISFPPSLADENFADLLPPLLLSYLNAGAKVHGTPAYDQDFSCLDLFTVLDFEATSSSHMRKYLASC